MVGKQKGYYRTGEVARRLGVSPKTLTKWMKEAKAPKDRYGHYMISEEMLKRYMEEQRGEVKKAKPSTGKPCPAAEELEPNLYQCPKTPWLRVQGGAPHCREHCGSYKPQQERIGGDCER